MAIAGVHTSAFGPGFQGRADWTWLRIFLTGANSQGSGSFLTSPNLLDTHPELRFLTGANSPGSGFRWLGVVFTKVGQI